MATVSLEEKKLRQLKQQLFGKADSTPYKITPKQIKELGGSRQHTASAVTLESVNLKSDLAKIAVLSAAAMTIQLSLFFAHQNGLIRFF